MLFPRYFFHVAAYPQDLVAARPMTPVPDWVPCGEGWLVAPSDRLDHRFATHPAPSSMAARKQILLHLCEWEVALEGCRPAGFPAIPSIGLNRAIPAMPVYHRPNCSKHQLVWRRGIGPFCDLILGGPTSYHVSELQAGKSPIGDGDVVANGTSLHLSRRSPLLSLPDQMQG